LNLPALSADQKNLVFLSAAALLLGLVGLGNVPLRDFDEGYYATVAQDTYLRGDWRFPTYHGQGFLLKPPLIMWLISLSYALLGINEVSTRLPMAVLSAIAVPLLYGIGREVFPERKTALYSAVMLLTLLPVVRLGRLAMLDGMINTFLLGSLLCLLKGRKNPWWLMGIGVGLGAIALCKGVIVVVLGGLLGMAGLWLGEWRLLKQWQLWLGLWLGFAPVFWWYGLQGAHYGEVFWQVHFQSQSFDRLATAVEGNTGPIWFYLLEIAKYTAPWLFFLVPAVWITVKHWREDWAKLCLGLGLGFLAIVSVMTTKLPWYLLPSYPFLALMGGYYLTDLESRKRYPRLIGYLLALTTFLVLIAGIYLSIVEQQGGITAIALVLGSGLGYGTWHYFQSSPRFVWGIVGGLYGGLLLLMISPLWNWEVNEAFAVPPVGELLKQNTPVKTVIYTSFTYSRPSLDFYGDRQVLAENDDRLRELAKQGNYLLLDAAARERLALQDLQWRGQAGEFTLFFSPAVSVR
jgi:4-amino-4-deoxy-L-arabinose transferase-like glycosyltransferase